MSTLHVLVMTFRTYIVLAVTVALIAACGGRSSSPGSHPAPSAARPLSCAQQFQNWRHGPAHAPASTLKAALN